MRVECQSVSDFLENLKSVPSESVNGKIVYVNLNRNPIDGTKRDAVKFNVVIQAFAVVDIVGGQYLLVCGEDCGRDYEDSSQEFLGSEKAKELRATLNGFCSERGLAIRPGSVSE